MTAFPLLSDERIDAIANQMPNGLDGFLKGWGWSQFAKAIESESRAPLLAEIERLTREQSNTQARLDRAILAAEEHFGEDAVRYKLSLSKNGRPRNCFPSDMDGKWFAFQRADDDAHVGLSLRCVEAESERDELREQVERLKADAEEAKRASFLEGYAAAEADAKVCMVPPIGWNCTREAGHEGPCAAVRDKDAEAIVKAGMKRLADAEQCDADELDTSDCRDCAGDGFTWEYRQVAERASDVQEFKIDCATCCGRGYVGPDADRRSAIDAARAQGGE